MNLTDRQGFRVNTIANLPNEEVWGFHPDYPHLKVSSLGKVYSLHTNRLLSIRTTYDGYSGCTVSFSNIKKEKLVHRLVCETFFGFVYSNLYEVNHIDGNKSHNSIHNLEWVTRAENLEHSKVNKLYKPVVKYKYSEQDLIDMIELRKLGYTVKQISESYGINKTQCTHILKRRGMSWEV